MKVSVLRSLLKSLAVVLTLAVPLVLAVPSADARIGGGFSSGSRGARSFTPPPSTSTAPNAARPFDRTMTDRAAPGFGTGMGGGFFGRPGLFGGLMAGFLGAGLLGMLFGGGLFGGLGGFASLIGLVLQIGVIVLIVRLVLSYWQRRNAAYAGASPYVGAAPAGGLGSGGGGGFGFGRSGPAPLQVTPGDYDEFERVLGEIQAAWSNEDVGALTRLATPEMLDYFTRDMTANQRRGVVNKVSQVKLLQGDLAEAWREGTVDYATVAMRFSLVDRTLDRVGGQLVEGSATPQEVTEIWTFRRDAGGPWRLSAIQQA
ncbi:MAG: Tim44-like domain-containing protein [Xanthobacteraceae bacterium]|nr:Tim44-like domain-containing protein [Xanthobacteraceae bacterium]